MLYYTTRIVQCLCLCVGVRVNVLCVYEETFYVILYGYGRIECVVVCGCRCQCVLCV